MPIMEEPTEVPRMRVSPSAPLELMWILHNLQAKHVLGGPYSSLEPLRAGLKERLTSFWGDGVRGFTETIVISERSGTTLDLDLHDFFARLDEAVEMRGGMPSLLTERPSERTALEGRLRRLREDPVLRERYRSLLLSAWEPVRPEWEAIGRGAVVAAAADWDRRLSEGADYHTLLERTRMWPGRPELDELASAAAAEGRVVLSPGWFFGVIHMVEVDGTLYMGRGVRAEDHKAIQRETATRIAGNLKVLADPTRLGILLWLASHPASVTEIAAYFELSQPTVSGHIQVLRDAGLLEDKLAGRRSKLIVARDRVKGLIDDAGSSMLRLFPQD
ncbi:MAG TPA: metalloregulator ArsR/SmtB family transcription factor [Candidatus Dormibacteraeota bacterium]